MTINRISNHVYNFKTMIQKYEPLNKLSVAVQAVFSTLCAPVKFFGRYIDKEAYHFKSLRENFPLMNPQEAKQYLPLVGLTASSYAKNDFSWSEPLVKIINPMTLNIQLPVGVMRNDRCLFDPSTGLKVYIARNCKHELIFCFGSLGSNNETKGLRSAQMIFSQHWANLGSLFGFNPRIYEQACEVVNAVKNNLNIADDKVVLTGHCLGGKIASYVSLRAKIKAVVFNSLPMGAGLQNVIGNSTLKEAHKYTTHISVERDYASDFYGLERIDKIFNFFRIRTPGNFGARYFINCPFNSLFAKHGYIVGSLLHHTGFNVHKPTEIPFDKIYS